MTGEPTEVNVACMSECGAGFQQDLLFAILGSLLIVIIVGAVVVLKIKDTDSPNIETQKLRFAAATFTGIMTLVLLTAIMAVGMPSSTAPEVFQTVITSLTPVAGGIIGYLFSSNAHAKGTASPPKK